MPIRERTYMWTVLPDMMISMYLSTTFACSVGIPGNTAWMRAQMRKVERQKIRSTNCEAVGVQKYFYLLVWGCQTWVPTCWRGQSLLCRRLLQGSVTPEVFSPFTKAKVSFDYLRCPCSADSSTRSGHDMLVFFFFMAGPERDQRIILRGRTPHKLVANIYQSCGDWLAPITTNVYPLHYPHTVI